MVRDYKNKEQRKQVWEDIDTEIGPPTGNFSSPEVKWVASNYHPRVVTVVGLMPDVLCMCHICHPCKIKE